MKQKTIIIALTLLFFSVNYSYSQITTKYDELKALYINYENNSVIEGCNKYIKEIGFDEEILYLKGNTLKRLRKYEEAKACFEEILTINKKHINAILEIAEIQENFSQYNYALSNYEKVIQHDSTNSKALNALADLYFKIDDSNKSLNYYQKLILNDSLNSYYYKQIALNYHRLNNKDLAFKYLRKAHELNKTDIGIISNLAFLYQNQQKFDSAIIILDRALAVDSTDTKIKEKKADCLFNLGKYESANKIYNYLNSVNEASDKMLQQYGISLYRAYEFEFSKDILLSLHSKLFLRGEPNPIICFYIGMAYNKINLQDSSIYFYNLAIKLNKPKYIADIYMNMGHSYSQKREHKKAIEAYKTGLEYDPEKYILYFYIAVSTEESDANKKNALVFYEKFINNYKGGDKKNIDYAQFRIHRIKEDLFMGEK